MSYNPNFYNKFRGNNATFQSNFQAHYVPPPPVPPPPVPPPFFIPPTPPPEKDDQEFLKSFEQKAPISHQHSNITAKTFSISEVREELRSMIVSIDTLKAKEKMLEDSIDSLSESEWSLHMKEIEQNKIRINKTLAHINGPHLDVLRKLLAKRAAKRLRLKRVRSEIKREKEERRKELEERSRKIDENLQKIKDDIIKAQQEQEAKLEADMVLKDVLRKKHDAKKCIVKLDALVKLRKARQNTAKGRGETVPENETNAFHTRIEKLKSLWTRKLAAYDVEEAQLRLKLKEDSAQLEFYTNITEREVAENLEKWKDVMFGGELPQVDFKGDVERFVAVRSRWDRYISNEGSTLPMGWVPPSKQ